MIHTLNLWPEAKLRRYAYLEAMWNRGAITEAEFVEARELERQFNRHLVELIARDWAHELMRLHAAYANVPWWAGCRLDRVVRWWFHRWMPSYERN